MIKKIAIYVLIVIIILILLGVFGILKYHKYILSVIFLLEGIILFYLYFDQKKPKE